MSNLLVGPTRVINGRPTEPEARLLLDHLRTLNDGDILTFDTMERITGLSRHATAIRFNTVTSRARKLYQDETGIRMLSERCVGWKVPAGDEQCEHHIGRVRGGARIIRRQGHQLAALPDDRLTDRGRSRKTHIVNATALIDAMARTQTRIPKFAAVITTNK